jgi:hypothetical protein
MEGRKTIDTESDVLKDLEEKKVDDSNLRFVVARLYEAVEILERYNSDRQDYDEADLERILPELQRYIAIIHQDIGKNQMYKKYLILENLVNFLVVLFSLIGASLQTTTVVSKEQYRQLMKTTVDLKNQLKGMFLNPNFHSFYRVYMRDLPYLPESIEAAIEFVDEGNYKAAAYELDTVLRKIRGAVREI